MSKPVVTMDLFPSPERWGWIGLILFGVGNIIIFLIWIYLGLFVAFISLVLWVNGAYIGRCIESQHHKNIRGLTFNKREVDEEKTG